MEMAPVINKWDGSIKYTLEKECYFKSDFVWAGS